LPVRVRVMRTTRARARACARSTGFAGRDDARACVVVLDLHRKSHLASGWLRIAEEINVNRSQLVHAVTESTQATRRTVEDVVEELFGTIILEVQSGRKVTVVGFGTFTPVRRAARTGRNPRTGAAVRIPASRNVRFATGSAFKSALTPKEELPMAVKKAAAKKAPARKTAAKKTAARKAPARKTAAKKTAAKKAVKRTTAKKAPARKTAAKKTTARKTTAKRAPARKTAAKKTTARKTTAKRAPARKTAARKTTAKRAPALKTAAKKAPARKTAAKKAPARKATAKRAPARKTAARKTTARKR